MLNAQFKDAEMTHIEMFFAEQLDKMSSVYHVGPISNKRTLVQYFNRFTNGLPNITGFQLIHSNGSCIFYLPK